MIRKLTMEELNRVTVEDFKNLPKTPVVVVLDNVRSLNNIGSVFRTADAFRLQTIYLCGITATPPHREIHKTALGSTESVDWEYFENTTEAVSKLKEKGFKIFAVEQTTGSTKLDDPALKLNGKTALIFGNELNGVGENIIASCDAAIEIPQIGTKHSLNLAVAAGIVLWEVFRRHKKSPAVD